MAAGIASWQRSIERLRLIAVVRRGGRTLAAIVLHSP
ncbi:MAG: hypothetical protein QOD37_21, partial [Gaiellales bacterium]|nr:hypothetical protein [Gaiellales bacterium]